MGVSQRNILRFGVSVLSVIVVLLLVAGGAAAGTLSGFVNDSNDDGIGDATVSVTLLAPDDPAPSELNYNDDTQTNDEAPEAEDDPQIGYYEITDLPEGTYLVNVNHSEFESYTDTVEVRDEDVTHKVSITALGSITGVTFRGNSNTGGIEGAMVYAIRTDDRNPSVEVGDVLSILGNEDRVPSDKTNEDGEYSFDGLSPGEYHLVTYLEINTGEPRVLFGIMETSVQPGEETTQHIRMNTPMDFVQNPLG